MSDDDYKNEYSNIRQPVSRIFLKQSGLNAIHYSILANTRLAPHKANTRLAPHKANTELAPHKVRTAISHNSGSQVAGLIHMRRGVESEGVHEEREESEGVHEEGWS